MNDQQHRVSGCRHRKLAVGWALHALLEPPDEALVTAHTPDCPIYTTTAAQTEKVGATLDLCVPGATPSTVLEQ